MPCIVLSQKAQDMPSREQKPLPPFSLRFTREERAQLEQDAVGISLGAYIRSRLFEESLPKRRTRSKHPVKDHQELAKVLAELGRSRLANNLNQLAKAANSGSLEVTLDTEQALQNACSDIRWMRHILMASLGLLPEDHHDS